MRLEDVITRGTRALQPAAADVAAGTLYHVTDEAITERSNGVIWQLFSGAGTFTVGVSVDGSQSPISPGFKGYRSVPFTGVITRARIFADVVGSIVFDIWNDTYANFPPTAADSICAAAKPTIAGANKYQDLTLTGWDVAVTAGDVLGFNVDSASTITKATLELEIRI